MLASNAVEVNFPAFDADGASIKINMAADVATQYTGHSLTIAAFKNGKLIANNVGGKSFPALLISIANPARVEQSLSDLDALLTFEATLTSSMNSAGVKLKSRIADALADTDINGLTATGLTLSGLILRTGEFAFTQ